MLPVSLSPSCCTLVTKAYIAATQEPVHWNLYVLMKRSFVIRVLLPVIIVTARPNQLFTAASSGAGALLEKPLDFPQLLETIRALLDEPTETRLARMAGRDTAFRYLPAPPCLLD